MSDVRTPGERNLPERLLDEARSRSRAVDRVARAVIYYRAHNGSTLAAATTYFAFLSFFPVLALAFAAVGFVSGVWPEAQRALVTGLHDLLPGMIGQGPGQISLSALQKAAGPVAGVGSLLVLYSGLSWITTMRSSLQTIFATPADDQPGLVGAYARDLLMLVVLGLGLVLTVALSTVMIGVSGKLGHATDLGVALTWGVRAVSIGLGLVSNVVLFVVMFRLLGEPPLPRRAVHQGALVGALGFELTKQASTWLLASTVQQPAFQAFGISLILLVWIYYFSRVVMFAAAWASTVDPADHAFTAA